MTEYKLNKMGEEQFDISVIRNEYSIFHTHARFFSLSHSLKVTQNMPFYDWVYADLKPKENNIVYELSAALLQCLEVTRCDASRHSFPLLFYLQKEVFMTLNFLENSTFGINAAVKEMCEFFFLILFFSFFSFTFLLFSTRLEYNLWRKEALWQVFGIFN